MTAKQLERKLKQLYTRRKLIQTVEELEESIRTFMAIDEKSEIRTASFILRLDGETLDISLRPQIHLNQLTFKFTEKEELRHETGHSKEALT